MSEAAKIALLQEVMREAKRNERGGLVACIVGVVVAVAGFSTISLAANSFNLGILGIVIAAIGFLVYVLRACIPEVRGTVGINDIKKCNSMSTLREASAGRRICFLSFLRNPAQVLASAWHARWEGRV